VNTHHRHGDLLFIKLDQLPTGARRSKDACLFKGTSLSNTHRLNGDGCRYDLTGEALQAFLSTTPRSIACLVKVGKKGASVVHEGTGSQKTRHQPITLTTGVWEVRREEDYTPQAIVAVND